MASVGWTTLLHNHSFRCFTTFLMKPFHETLLLCILLLGTGYVLAQTLNYAELVEKLRNDLFYIAHLEEYIYLIRWKNGNPNTRQIDPIMYRVPEKSFDVRQLNMDHLTLFDWSQQWSPVYSNASKWVDLTRITYYKEREKTYVVFFGLSEHGSIQLKAMVYSLTENRINHTFECHKTSVLTENKNAWFVKNQNGDQIITLNEGGWYEHEEKLSMMNGYPIFLHERARINLMYVNNSKNKVKFTEEHNVSNIYPQSEIKAGIVYRGSVYLVRSSVVDRFNFDMKVNVEMPIESIEWSNFFYTSNKDSDTSTSSIGLWIVLILVLIIAILIALAIYAYSQRGQHRRKHKRHSATPQSHGHTPSSNAASSTTSPAQKTASKVGSKSPSSSKPSSKVHSKSHSSLKPASKLNSKSPSSSKPASKVTSKSHSTSKPASKVTSKLHSSSKPTSKAMSKKG